MLNRAYRVSLSSLSVMLFVLLFVVGFVSTPVVARAATITVTIETNDTTNGNGCSLREAIENANNDAQTHPDCAAGTLGLDTIVFGGSVNTINSTAVMSINEDLLITGPVIIDGGSAARIFTIASSADVTLTLTTLQNAIDSAILISSGTLNASLCNFNNNVSAPSGGGAINASGTENDVDINGCIFDTNSSPNGDGGAIQKGTNGTMNVGESFFVDNTAGGTGGAIDTGGPGTIFATAFQDNEAQGASNNDGGGAIYFDSGAAFTITASAFSGNLATGDAARGGAIFSSGTSAPSALNINYSHFGTTPVPLPSPFDTLTDPNEARGTSGVGGAIYTRSPTSILGSSFIGNTTNGDGGAIASSSRDDGAPFIANSTLSDNTAEGAGGAVYQFADGGILRGIDLINVTIANNRASASNGSGVFVDEFSGGNAQISISNSILSNNSGNNCAQTSGTVVVDAGDNLVFGSSCPGITPVETGNPNLQAAELTASLPNILTYVTPLGLGSAASGAGNPTTCANFPILNLDQRGFQRPDGDANCDIGAYESEQVPEPSAVQNFAAALVALLGLRARRRR